MFSLFKTTFSKIYQQFTTKINALLSRQTLDEQTAQELYQLFISADMGAKTANALIQTVQDRAGSSPELNLTAILEEKLTSLLIPFAKSNASIIMLVGVNGSGKTTFAGKLSQWYRMHNKKVLIAACDTFRAAAPQQLELWAQTTGATLVRGNENQDPSSVLFNACQKFQEEHYDVLIIDTAGRLQTKINLMHELAKLKKVITKVLPHQKISTLLTIDAMLGQNSFEQARLFNECTPIDGIALTKMDGTGKGGIVFAINQELKIPVAYISYGEKIDQFSEFDAKNFVHQLLQQ